MANPSLSQDKKDDCRRHQDRREGSDGRLGGIQQMNLLRAKEYQIETVKVTENTQGGYPGEGQGHPCIGT